MVEYFLMTEKGITPGRINRCFGVILAIFLALAGFLYWQGYIQALGFILAVIIIATAGIWCTFDTRRVQRDGFLDGYNRAKNSFDQKKKAKS